MKMDNFYGRGFYFKVTFCDSANVTYKAIQILPMWMIKLIYKRFKANGTD